MLNFDEMSLDELEDLQWSLEKEIDDFFDATDHYSGDQGYQDLLQKLDEVIDEIERRQNERIHRV